MTQNPPKIVKETRDYKDNHHKQNPALTIEECKPDGDFRIGLCIPLPSNVSESSIFNNIISSFKHSFQATHEKKIKDLKDKFRNRKVAKKTRLYPEYPGDDVDMRITKYLEDDEDKVMKQLENEEETTRNKLDKKLEAWKAYLRYPQNKHVISDAFWYMRYHLVKEPESEEITEFLLGRMAKNYIDLFLSVSGIYKDSFFKVTFVSILRVSLTLIRTTSIFSHKECSTRSSMHAQSPEMSSTIEKRRFSSHSFRFYSRASRSLILKITTATGIWTWELVISSKMTSPEVYKQIASGSNVLL